MLDAISDGFDADGFAEAALLLLMLAMGAVAVPSVGSFVVAIEFESITNITPISNNTEGKKKK